VDKLFTKVTEFRKNVFRNIVSLREQQDLFDDLTEGNTELSAIAIEAEARVKENMPLGFIEREFHYSQAIGYPFETQPFMASRYGDGAFGVWYGSVDSLETSIFESAYHMIQDELNIYGLREIVVRERAVYLVFCEGILIDLIGRERDYSQLISDDYSYTQSIGRRLAKEGHPGLRAPSARCKGVNVAIFNPDILANPRNHLYLTYRFDPATRNVEVERQPGALLMTVSFSSTES
jgi:hypothetical protein